MNIHSIRARALLPALAAAWLAGAGPAAAAADAVGTSPLRLAQALPDAASATKEAAKGKPFRVTPPARPNAPTLLAPGEPPEEVKRNRHGHNELKVRGKGRDNKTTR